MHLVNNPLMLVCGFAQQLMMKFKKDGVVEDTVQKLKVINEKSLQASQVLRAVMEYVRRTTEQQMEIVLLKSLIREVVEQLKKQPEWEKIEVKIDFQNEGAVLADVGQIQQVVTALLSRQWEWLQGEGEIQVALNVKNDEIVLTIADLKVLMVTGNVDDGTVAKQDFGKLGLDIERLWQDLIEKGYINEKGQIQGKFKGLKSASEMQLRQEDIGKRDDIWGVLQRSHDRLEKRTEALGVVGYMVKPFQMEKLQEVLAKVLQGTG